MNIIKMIRTERMCWLATAVVAVFVGISVLKTTFVTGFPECSDYDFPCEDGGCIDSGLWCESTEDCADGSDEKYCKKSTLWNPDPNKCPSNYFKCNDGPCIPIAGRCDGYESCDDSSDEMNCASPSSTTESYSTTRAVPSFRPGIKYYTTVSTTVQFPTSDFEGSNAIRFFNSLNVSENAVQLEQFSGAEFSDQRKRARNWLLSQRRIDYGWGGETARAITALYLSDEHPIIKNTEGGTLMIKQLEIQLTLELAKNVTKPMKLTDLALYINALLLSCKNPKNFYGDNLIHTLRDGADASQKEDKFVNPSIYLTLCANNATTYNDTKKLHDMFLSKNDTVKRIDILALAILTASCIFQKTDFLNATMFDSIKMEFLRNVKIHGFPGNVHEAALLEQALQELKVSLKGSTSFILKQQEANGSFGDILATYLALPVLAGKNMNKMMNPCGQQNIPDLIPLEVLKNVKQKKMHVQYSLNYGYPPEVTQSIQMHVAEETSLLDVMRLAQESNPKYRFKLSENRKIPVVYSIGDMPNDVEKGMYWRLYKASENCSELTNDKHWDPYVGDLKKLILANGDKVLFWYRPL